jgi:hypothetical protein
MNAIQTNDILTIGFIGDSQLKPTCKVLSRKGSFATIQLSEKEVVRRKVNKSSCGEYEFVYPYGVYSMCPTAKK